MRRLRLELDLPVVYNEGDVTIITGVNAKEVRECLEERFDTGIQNHIRATDGRGTYKNVLVVQVSTKDPNNYPFYYAEAKLK